MNEGVWKEGIPGKKEITNITGMLVSNEGMQSIDILRTAVGNAVNQYPTDSCWECNQFISLAS